jgi:hypothetical protein
MNPSWWILEIKIARFFDHESMLLAEPGKKSVFGSIGQNRSFPLFCIRPDYGSLAPDPSDVLGSDFERYRSCRREGGER